MSGFEISPASITASHTVQRYGDGKFGIADEVYKGSVIVFSDHAQLWPVQSTEDITASSLLAIVERSDDVDILVLGCGERFGPPPQDLRAALKEHGIVLEWMDTGAACRTFNVLLSEARRVAAALIAVV
ncbi:MAG: hypothetical protein HN644_04760 [Rhodospirillales bacterium]|jgi:uncharacterized protein|nr:hypothetical protein [Rhodospirillales bacterium]MBT4041130.1 hypothetical protein [Rhodospirillales bacterium]MBT4626718.1 hypothetical protein [Rhodospirillales bacterium]MBT5350722.1 hypothetical protein [Rhodospirillales bacterium]MBT5519562.1 hypothetical protein [Rhodospirillales bacterium]